MNVEELPDRDRQRETLPARRVLKASVELAAVEQDAAERERVRERYRFYSYGDAMLIL